MIAPKDTVPEPDALMSAPLWRREPYRIFFPMGIALAIMGVGHWLLHALGMLDEYRPVFHATTQVQGFLTAFAVGFLFTMIPRRTGTSPPSSIETVVPMLALPVVAIAGWQQRWVVVETSWLIVAATVSVFAIRRFTSASAKRRPPDSFVWIPAAFAMGAAGAMLTAAYGMGGARHQWMHEIGRDLLLQGLFTGLVLGVGGLALPLMTRGEAPPDASRTAGSRMARAGHVAAAALLVLSFWMEWAISLRAGYALRAAVVLTVLLLEPQIWRLPAGEAWNRRLIWLAAWMIPAGFAIAAAFPSQHSAGLHIVFIGGFAMLAFGVGTQVVLGHGGYRELLVGRPFSIALMGALLLQATVARTLMELDRARYFSWMAVAAASFLCAAIVWLLFAGSKLWFAPSDRRP